MPEGDTIHRTADALRRALLGRTLTRVELPRVPAPHPRPGATVDAIEARGKHLLIATSDELVVHTHLRMTGSWHLYRPGERWRKATRAARAVLAVDGALAVCFAAPVVAVLAADRVERHPALRHLGPDLTAPTADLDAAVERMARFSTPDRPIGEALLDQRIACGVGNVYRSEVLFLHGVHPATAVDDVPTEIRERLLDTAAHLLRRNLDTAARTTVTDGAPGPLWVYGRAGEPCRRCATPIERSHLGDHARVVSHCPVCQPAP